jgi:hypothetical protein
MTKAILTISVAVFLLIDVGTSAQAAELRFQCADNEGSFPIIVDTKTKSVLLGEPNLLRGRAVITGASISITLDENASYHGRIDRRTGALSATDGNGRCTLAK